MCGNLSIFAPAKVSIALATANNALRANHLYLQVGRRWMGSIGFKCVCVWLLQFGHLKKEFKNNIYYLIISLKCQD